VLCVDVSLAVHFSRHLQPSCCARCLGDMYVYRKHVYMPPRRMAQRRVWPRHRGCSCP
jgi:hypothetical protein